jgi:hypothetical protein
VSTGRGRWAGEARNSEVVDFYVYSFFGGEWGVWIDGGWIYGGFFFFMGGGLHGRVFSEVAVFFFFFFFFFTFTHAYVPSGFRSPNYILEWSLGTILHDLTTPRPIGVPVFFFFLHGSMALIESRSWPVIPII